MQIYLAQRTKFAIKKATRMNYLEKFEPEF